MDAPVAIEVAEGLVLEGDLVTPDPAGGLVLFVHGSGSSRHSPRNRAVAEALQKEGLATLLFDLLTADEERVDARTAALRFDIVRLAERTIGAVDWVRAQPDLAARRIGLFGASTGAAAALVAAAARPDAVHAVVSRGGRPDLAAEALGEVRAPVLLLVGGRDPAVLELNREAAERLRTEHRIDVVPGATHLFEEPGALEEVAERAAAWFLEQLPT